MVLIGSDTYEDLTPETFEKVLDALGRGETPKPGPQNGRQFSAPIGGDTTLTDRPIIDVPLPPASAAAAAAIRARGPAANSGTDVPSAFKVLRRSASARSSATTRW
jgi:NADH-quinone oxidoreductase subunit E